MENAELHKCKTKVQRKATKFAMKDFVTERQKDALYHGFYMGYNQALVDIKKEVEERRDFMYARYIKKGIACIEEYRYDQCVELLNFIDNLIK